MIKALELVVHALTVVMCYTAAISACYLDLADPLFIGVVAGISACRIADIINDSINW